MHTQHLVKDERDKRKEGGTRKEGKERWLIWIQDVQYLIKKKVERRKKEGRKKKEIKKEEMMKRQLE